MTHRLGGDDDGDGDSDAGVTESADPPNKPSGRIANGDESFQSTALGPGGNVTQSLLEHFKKIITKTDMLFVVPESSKGPLAWRCNNLYHDAIRFAEEGTISPVIY
ncbi:hypothetical protein BAE44_0008659 [Dichanthelium oligosanthes]|uniref:Uncharacterized protein n=1 Tax=Dichanthelium oligosanthes TaxID=888268 RepID=A0A1E5VYW1_9POAL|nr:hypothetical protein BAE44_0008659 [Dichanthelium oligosanthes]